MQDGLAESSDAGNTWAFVRGADNKDKIAGLYANRQFEATTSGIELRSQYAFKQ